MQIETATCTNIQIIIRSIIIRSKLKLRDLDSSYIVQ